MKLFNAPQIVTLLAALILMFTFTTSARAQEASAEVGEKIVANQLSLIKSSLDQFYFIASQEEGYQVGHACLYSIFLEWQSAYLDVLERTPLDKMQINGLPGYAKFSASLLRGYDGLDVLYPTLIENVNLFIARKRADTTWPASVGTLDLDNPQADLFKKNLASCYESNIKADLMDSLESPDLIGFSNFQKQEYNGVFRSSEAGGIKLDIEIDSKPKPSDLGVAVQVASEAFLVKP